MCDFLPELRTPIVLENAAMAEEMGRDSNTLRTALQAAEAAVQLAAEEARGESDFDAAAVSDFEGAAVAIRRWRRALEAGMWPGRSVPAALETRERIHGVSE